ncbi:kinase [Hirsutella rhossiliensis]
MPETTGSAPRVYAYMPVQGHALDVVAKHDRIWRVTIGAGLSAGFKQAPSEIFHWLVRNSTLLKPHFHTRKMIERELGQSVDGINQVQTKSKADLLQLARYVRGVFADQPTRRFVHAFSLCSSKMELWVFDRSGPYSSGLFDIHDEPDKFARALVGYATMSSSSERGHRHATLDDTSGNETRVRLEQLIVRQRAIYPMLGQNLDWYPYIGAQRADTANLYAHILYDK